MSVLNRLLQRRKRLKKSVVVTQEQANNLFFFACQSNRMEEGRTVKMSEEVDSIWRILDAL